MCGRFLQLVPNKQLRQLLGIDIETGLDSTSFLEPNPRPRYNIAPTQHAAVVLPVDDHLGIDSLHWGLRSTHAGTLLINARLETAETKPTFTSAWTSARCIVPISGYYEWQKIPGASTKQPWLINRPAEPVIWAAGLTFGLSPRSFVILTTAAPPKTPLGAIHDRVPVMLTLEDARRWLAFDTEFSTHESLNARAITTGYTFTPVSTLVNSVRNDSPQCIEPVTPEGNLFD